MKPRICFVSHLAYGAFAGGTQGFIGGVERQTALMARWFARRGHPVSVLTWDEGQGDGTEIDGVRILTMCRKEAGIKGLRFFWPKWTSLVAAMKRADAEVYYQNCGEYVTGQVALWCRRHRRAFVYSVASDPDCDVRLPEMHKIRERVLYRYGLKHADRVIVQTRRQQKMLQASFQRESVVIPMPCPGPSDGEYADHEGDRNGSQRVLWIGRICEVKRPDRLLDLAQACPDVTFDLVGPLADTEYSRGVCARAKTLGNVVLHGPAARERVSEFYRNARIMCCTSDYEGFPNTFLEAWSHGLPIVSTIDPDSVVVDNHMGVIASDQQGLAQGIRTLLGDSRTWLQASRFARQYHLRNHTVDSVMPRFQKVFREVVNKSSCVNEGTVPCQS
ncbi:MAG: glycosyltransferase family 4 protein [Sedimentisphaerales bacterium]|nr:glycosyltransferase family 4 protein [Sedimentisphaerales bacterium]